MFGPIVSMAKQALDDMRKNGVDPLVQERIQDRTSKPTPPPPMTWLCGLDLGMMSDPTALAIVRKTVDEHNGKRVNRYAVLHLQRWLGIDYPTIGEELRPMLEQLSPKPTLIGDETGVGIATLQIFRRLKLPASIKGINITAGHQTTLRATGGYNVPSKELIACGQSALQGKRLNISPKLSDAKVLRRELQNFQVKVNATSMTESYEAYREGSSHGDLVFAVCMAVWYGENGGSRLGPEHFYLG